MKSNLSKIGIVQEGPVDLSGPSIDAGNGMSGPGNPKPAITGQRSFWWLISVFTIIVIMFVTACPVCGREIVDRVVAVVNNEIVSLYDLNQRVEPFIKKIKKTPGTLSEQNELIRKVMDKHIDLLIDEKLADQEIRRLKIHVGKKQVDLALDRFRSTNGLTMEQLESALTDQGRSLESFREEIKAQILRARLVNQEINSKVVITKDDVTAYYKSHPEEFGAVKKYRLKNIVMAGANLQDQDGSESVRQKMEQVHEKLMAGESFGDMARAYSHAPNAGDGGILGAIPANILAPNIRKAIEALHPGEFTDVIETDQGYQVFYLEAVDEESAESIEKSRARIEDTLYEQMVNKKYADWLKDLRSRAQIKLIK